MLGAETVVAMALALLVGSPGEQALSEARLELIAADGVDANGYLTARPASLAAGRERLKEVTACARGMFVDISDPVGSIRFSVYLKIAADGRVAHLDLKSDPTTGIVHGEPSQAAKCVGPIVKNWRFPDRGVLILRFALAPPARPDPKLPAQYLETLQAICRIDSNASVEKLASRIRAALREYPSVEIEKMMNALGGQTPATRAAIIRAVLANAGIGSCPVLGP
jgi:hypothetical protein